MSLKRTFSGSELALPPDPEDEQRQVIAPTEGNAPQVIVPQVIVPQVIVPQVIVPQVIVPQVIVPQAVVPQAVVPQAVVPQAIAPNVDLIETTVQDLPEEIMQFILIKVVITEVKSLKVVKSMWKAKANVISGRLGTVCVQWKNILTSKHGRLQICRVLDESREALVRVEVLQRHSLPSVVYRITAVGSRILVLTRPNDSPYVLQVFQRDRMDEGMEVIPLPETQPRDISSCSASNCGFLLTEDEANNDRGLVSVYRITTGDETLIQPYLADLDAEGSALSVSVDGLLCILFVDYSNGNGFFRMYDADGVISREIVLPVHLTWLSFGDTVLHRLNGNFVIASSNDFSQSSLTEFCRDGTIVRKYQATVCTNASVNFADQFERILLITDQPNIFILLDPEFNVVGNINTETDVGRLDTIHFCKESGEVLGLKERSLVVLRCSDV